MTIDQALDRKVGKVLLKEYEQARADHEPSGKLSASMLGQPIQWQVLKLLGILPEPLDEYVVRKFRRGDHVEEWAVKQMGSSVVETQKPVEYKKTVGLVDAMVDTDKWEFPHGIIPHEIKSVSNLKYKRIVGTKMRPGNGPDRAHMLQAALYALAEGKDWFAIDYVATDDYRVTTYVLKAADYKDEIDQIIDTVYAHVEAQTIPAFEPAEPWQANPQYTRFLDWQNLSDEECRRKFEMLANNEVLYEQIKLETV